MVFEIDPKKKYPILFVGFYENKLNQLIVRLTEEYHVTNTFITKTEINMKSEVMKRTCPRAPFDNVLKNGTTIIMPKVEDMVLVSDSNWLGLRRALVLELLDEPDKNKSFLVHLLDHGQKHKCPLAKMFPMLEAYRDSRPQVFILELDRISDIVLDANIQNVNSKRKIVQDWLKSRDHKLYMSNACMTSFYELVGNIYRYEKNLSLSDEDTPNENLIQYMMQNNFFPNLEYHCQLLKYGVRILYDSSTSQNKEEGRKSILCSQTSEKKCQEILWWKLSSSSPVNIETIDDSPVSQEDVN